MAEIEGVNELVAVVPYGAVWRLPDGSLGLWPWTGYPPAEVLARMASWLSVGLLPNIRVVEIEGGYRRVG